MQICRYQTSVAIPGTILISRPECERLSYKVHVGVGFEDAYPRQNRSNMEDLRRGMFSGSMVDCGMSNSLCEDVESMPEGLFIEVTNPNPNPLSGISARE
jgi:hypothetical protein